MVDDEHLCSGGASGLKGSQTGIHGKGQASHLFSSSNLQAVVGVILYRSDLQEFIEVANQFISFHSSFSNDVMIPESSISSFGQWRNPPGKEQHAAPLRKAARARRIELVVFE
jgi:hypothetical protein